MRAISLLVAFHAAAIACAGPQPADGVAQAAKSLETVEKQPAPRGRSATDLDADRDRIAALRASGDLPSCQALIPFVADSEEDLRTRAAQALYDKCGNSSALPGIGDSLRRSLELGTPSAPAYLLLGRVPGSQTVAALDAFANGTQPVKLQPWMLPVPVALPAAVALLRAGQGRARDRVQAAARGSLAESVFLLHVLGDVDDPAVLRSAVALLADQREIAEGVPSGATPRRRVADLAADRIVERLALKVGFPLSPSSRYSEAHLMEVRAAADGALSR